LAIFILGYCRGSETSDENMATIDDFHKLDVRVGKIIGVEDFPQAKKPSYKLTIDLGTEIGIKKSSAQLVKKYTAEDLKGRLVLCVVNFPPRQIGPFVSEVLTLGVPDSDGECILITPERTVPVGGKLY
jgi:tRNA-binding protein